jgi:hypothetical protein
MNLEFITTINPCYIFPVEACLFQPNKNQQLSAALSAQMLPAAESLLTPAGNP